MATVVSVILAVLTALGRALPGLTDELVRQWGEGAAAMRGELAALRTEREELREYVARLEVERMDLLARIRAAEPGANALERLGGGAS